MSAVATSYWCVYCGREIAPEVVECDDGTEHLIYVHDDIVHPVDATYDEGEVEQ